MKKQFYSVIAGLSMLGLVTSAAQAAPVGTISILDAVDGDDVVEVFRGDMFSVSIVGTGFEDNADAGDLTVMWDPAVITYEKPPAVNIANPPWDTQFVNDTGAETTGELDSIFLGTSTFGGVGPDFDIATLSFTVVGNPGDSTEVSATNALVGWFAPGPVELDITYKPLTVTMIPIPAAVWLFGSALLGLVGVARRRKTA